MSIEQIVAVALVAMFCWTWGTVVQLRREVAKAKKDIDEIDERADYFFNLLSDVEERLRKHHHEPPPKIPVYDWRMHARREDQEL